MRILLPSITKGGIVERNLVIDVKGSTISIRQSYKIVDHFMLFPTSIYLPLNSSSLEIIQTYKIENDIFVSL